MQSLCPCCKCEYSVSNFDTSMHRLYGCNQGAAADLVALKDWLRYLWLISSPNISSDRSHSYWNSVYDIWRSHIFVSTGSTAKELQTYRIRLEEAVAKET